MRNQKTASTPFVIFVLFLVRPSLEWPFEVSQENDWNGRWFPHAEDAPDVNEVIDYKYNKSDIHDDKHGIQMGIPTHDCDNGKFFLQQDWLDDPVNYTCYDDKRAYLPREDIYPVYISEHIPTHYIAQHKCMDRPIFYNRDVPTFGPHRPLWAKFGEYKFLPKQRWIHNLEHGSIVMLYHPCANDIEINLLRNLVANCLYRHVITPFNLLPPTRPLALVAWGRKLYMSKVDPAVVENFIKIAAKRGPEQLSLDGQYDYELKEHAQLVSTKDDDVLCPNSSVTETME